MQNLLHNEVFYILTHILNIVLFIRFLQWDVEKEDKLAGCINIWL